MKKKYTLLIAVMLTVSAFSQTDYPTNATGNNVTATSVLLSDFKAIRATNSINLSWVATAESNIASHVIEKSANGSSFSPIGTLVAQNNAAPSRYLYSDATPVAGFNYYRVRSTDKSGKATYSNILKIDNSYRRQELHVMPNPVTNGVLNMQMSNFNSGKYNIALYSNAGHKVFARSFDYSDGSSMETVYLPRSLGRGMYVLHLTNGETRINKQVILQ